MPVESKMNASDVEKAVTTALQTDAALKKAHRKKMLIAGIVGGLVIALALAGAIWRGVQGEIHNLNYTFPSTASIIIPATGLNV